MKWFGSNFGPICDDVPEVPVPVGALCVHCDEPILAGDTGVLITQFRTDREHELTEHHECFIRQIVGSVGHQRRLCSCYGATDLSEENLTIRQAAVLARDYFTGKWPRRTYV